MAVRPSTAKRQEALGALPAVRIGAGQELTAAIRLVSQSLPDRAGAARRLLAAGPANGIDLSLTWVTLEPSGSDRRSPVRQACLAVPGAGRTAMLFVSEPPPGGDLGGAEVGRAERVSVVGAACEFLSRLTTPDGGQRVAIAQGLPEPTEAWTIEALEGAGFTCVGQLAYMRRRLAGQGESFSPRWPRGVDVVRVDSIGAREAQDRVLIRALDESYIATLDCPELCGLRDTRDVLDSHRAMGMADAAGWYVVLDAGEPAGCMLVNRLPEQRSVDLVYLGLGPSLRRRGIGRGLLRMGEAYGRSVGAAEMSCAVDTRNVPALGLYRGFGFKDAARRIAYVRPIARKS